MLCLQYSHTFIIVAVTVYASLVLGLRETLLQIDQWHRYMLPYLSIFCGKQAGCLLISSRLATPLKLTNVASQLFGFCYIFI